MIFAPDLVLLVTNAQHILNAHRNANLTLWGNTAAEGGYAANWPRNKLYPGGCNNPASTVPGGPQPLPKAEAFTKAEIGTDDSLCKPLTAVVA